MTYYRETIEEETEKLLKISSTIEALADMKADEIKKKMALKGLGSNFRYSIDADYDGPYYIMRTDESNVIRSYNMEYEVIKEDLKEMEDILSLLLVLQGV